jgi:hypothetical protein
VQLKYLRQFHSLLTDGQIQHSSAFKDLLKLSSRVSANLIDRLDPEPIKLPSPAADATDAEHSADAEPRAAEEEGSPQHKGDDKGGKGDNSNAAPGAPLSSPMLLTTACNSNITMCGARRDTLCDDLCSPSPRGCAHAVRACPLAPSQRGCRAELDPVLLSFPEGQRAEALEKLQHMLANLLCVELLFEKGPREVTMILKEYSWREAVAVQLRERGQGAHALQDASGVCLVSWRRPTVMSSSDTCCRLQGPLRWLEFLVNFVKHLAAA